MPGGYIHYTLKEERKGKRGANKITATRGPSLTGTRKGKESLIGLVP